VLGAKPTMSHVAARREIRELIDCLHLPVDAPDTAPIHEAILPQPPAPESAPATVL
jgi:hypothetical protein